MRTGNYLKKGNRLQVSGLLTAVILSCVLPSCTAVADEPVKMLEYAFIKDPSTSGLNFSSAAITQQIYDQLSEELSVKNSGKGANLYLASCGNSSIPEVKTISLKPSTWWLTPRDKRAEDVKTFTKKYETGIDSLFQIPLTHSRSNIYRSLVHVVKQMDQTATERKLILVSDLIESSELLEMHNYEPDSLLSSYDSIVTALQVEEALPDQLAGMEIILVCPGEHELVVQASRLWQRFLESAGAKVEVRSTL